MTVDIKIGRISKYFWPKAISIVARGTAWADENAEGWEKWAFCVNANLSNLSNALKKLNVK